MIVLLTKFLNNVNKPISIESIHTSTGPDQITSTSILSRDTIRNSDVDQVLLSFCGVLLKHNILQTINPLRT